MSSTPLSFLLPGIYSLSLWSLCFAFLFSLRREVVSAVKMFGAVTLMSGISAFLIIIVEYRLPLFGPFESGMYILFIFLLMELVFQWAMPSLSSSPSPMPRSRPRQRSISRSIPISFQKPLIDVSREGRNPINPKQRTAVGSALFGLFIMALILPHPKAFNGDFFMYGNVWVNLFFNLRLVATALFCRAAMMFLIGASVSWRWTDDDKPLPKSLLGREPGDADHPKISTPTPRYCPNSPMDNAQNFFFKKARGLLLIALAFFLCSEWAGSWWCLNWLGDSWRWSQVFFKAAMVFILVMAACHLPPVLAKSPSMKGIFGAFPALYLLWMIFYH